jgi:Protein of unknown function (DUF2510)
MSTHPRTTQQRAAAGWHPDPLGAPGQLRWWDGNAWTSSVQTPAAPQPGTAAPDHRPRRKRRTIAWAALGAFALGVSGIVIAVRRGQDVCAVSATGIEFCRRDDDARQQIEEAQPELQEQASELQDQAQELGTGDTPPGTADLTGTWLGDKGFTYFIEQYGDQAVISEIGLGGMTTAVGSGFVDGPLFTFDFQAVDGSFGRGSLELDGDTLTGSFDNLVTGFSTPVVLHR